MPVMTASTWLVPAQWGCEKQDITEGAAGGSLAEVAAEAARKIAQQ